MLDRSSLLAGVAAVTTYYGFQFYSSISLPSAVEIKTAGRIPGSFAQSFAVSAVNPHHHVTIDDTRSAHVSVPNSLSHDQILGKFLIGFFGGKVFAPERMALRLMRRQLVNFNGEQLPLRLGTSSTDQMTELADEPISSRIWTAGDVGDVRLPPLHSVLFGAFRVVDIQCSNTPELSSTAEYSYIDIAFGADDGFIAGVHRFSVSEVEDLSSIEGTRHITISFDHTSCNPRQDKPLSPEVFQTFHLWYAKLLFREGLVSVMKAE
jgi:hypothetical protein